MCHDPAQALCFCIPGAALASSPLLGCKQHMTERKTPQAVGDMGQIGRCNTHSPPPPSPTTAQRQNEHTIHKLVKIMSLQGRHPAKGTLAQHTIHKLVKIMSLQGRHPAKGTLAQQPRLAIAVEHKGDVCLVQLPARWSPVLGEPIAQQANWLAAPPECTPMHEPRNGEPHGNSAGRSDRPNQRCARARRHMEDWLCTGITSRQAQFMRTKTRYMYGSQQLRRARIPESS